MPWMIPLTQNQNQTEFQVDSGQFLLDPSNMTLAKFESQLFAKPILQELQALSIVPSFLVLSKILELLCLMIRDKEMLPVKFTLISILVSYHPHGPTLQKQLWGTMPALAYMMRDEKRMFKDFIEGIMYVCYFHLI